MSRKILALISALAFVTLEVACASSPRTKTQETGARTEKSVETLEVSLPETLEAGASNSAELAVENATSVTLLSIEAGGKTLDLNMAPGDKTVLKIPAGSYFIKARLQSDGNGKTIEENVTIEANEEYSWRLIDIADEVAYSENSKGSLDDLYDFIKDYYSVSYDYLEDDSYGYLEDEYYDSYGYLEDEYYDSYGYLEDEYYDSYGYLEDEYYDSYGYLEDEYYDSYGYLEDEYYDSYGYLEDEYYDSYGYLEDEEYDSYSYLEENTSAILGAWEGTSSITDPKSAKVVTCPITITFYSDNSFFMIAYFTRIGGNANGLYTGLFSDTLDTISLMYDASSKMEIPDCAIKPFNIQS